MADSQSRSAGGQSPTGSGPAESSQPDDERLAEVQQHIGEARQAADEVAGNEDMHSEEADRQAAGAFEPSGDDTDAGEPADQDRS